MNRISRRGFVGTGALAAAAACLGTRPAGATIANWMVNQDQPQRYRKAVKIGMVNVPGSLKDKFQVLKELGFDGVEMDSPTETKADEVRAASEATGLPVHGVVDSIHWNKTLSHSDEAVRLEGLEGLKTAIRDSKAFGGTSVLLVPGVCNKEVTYEQAWERSIPLIKQALPLADELKIDILLENVWNNFLTDPKETARYIDEIGSDRVGAYYDVGNSVRYANPVEWVKVLGKRIRKLDIKEYDLELGKSKGWYEGFKPELLEGGLPWHDVMVALKELGFSGWATAEIPGGDRARLKNIAERMDRIFAS
jgi:hexulose-6-phosphate isomerase